LPENGRVRQETIACMKTFYPKLLILLILALPTAAAAQRGDAGYTEDRLNQLQQSITLLTGQIEQLQYRNQQLMQQMEKMAGRTTSTASTSSRRAEAAADRDRARRPPQVRRRPRRRRRPRQGRHLPTRQVAISFTTMPSRCCRTVTMAGAERAFKTFVQRKPAACGWQANAQYWLGRDLLTPAATTRTP